jgi:hypothetical protein
MRELGIPKVTSWRWAPCAALVLGSCSFVAFALLVIPDRIDTASADGAASMRLGNHFASNQMSPPAADWSGNGPSTATHIDNARPSTVTRVATHGSEVFPKRGFTPPLERPASEPPPPPAVIPQVPPPAVIPQVPPAPPQAEPPAPPEAAVPPPEAPAAQPELPPPGAAPAPAAVTPENN